MYSVTDEKLAQLVDDIVKEVRPEAIYLFGSRARGDHHEQSDVDLLIIEREPFSKERSRYKETAKLYLLTMKHRMSVDILLYSRDEVEDWRTAPGHVIARALSEGKILYDAA